MDLQKQLEEFYSRLDHLQLSAEAIALYLTLLIIGLKATKSEADKWFSVANLTLQSKCKNLTLKKLQNARNELINNFLIDYKKGANQNKAAKYCMIRLCNDINNKNGQAEGTAQDIPEGTAKGVPQGMPEGNIIKTKLNLLFNYLISNDQTKNFENITQKDKQSIVSILKRLDLYTDKVLDVMPKERLTAWKVEYFVIKELYFSSYRVYLNNLTLKTLEHKYQKANEYIKARNRYNRGFNTIFNKVLTGGTFEKHGRKK